jgi:MFS family permease
MIASGLVYLLCWIPWLAGLRAPLPATLALFAAMGFAVSGFTLSWATVKEVNPPAFSGTAMALVNTGVFLGPTLYQPLVGWVLDRHGQRAALGVLVAFAAMGFLATLLVREAGGRNQAAG